MNIGIFEVGIIAIFAQLLLFSGFLFFNYKKNPSNIFLGVQLFSQAMGIFQGFCNVQYNFIVDNFPHLYFLGYSFAFLWGPTFYIYVKTAAYKDYWNKKTLLPHFIPFIICLIYLLATFFFQDFESLKNLLRSKNYPLLSHDFVFNSIIRIHVLIYIIFSLRVLVDVNNKIKDNFSSISQSNYSWIRFLVIGFITCYCLTVPLMIYSYLTNYETSYYTSFIILMPYFIYFYIIFFKGWSHPELFAGLPDTLKYKYSKLTKDEAEKLISKLNLYIEKEKPFLNCNLTLNILAEKINSSPRILSQVINEYVGQNFYDYINKLRVEESKKRLADLSSNKTVLEILYEVGFNSKSAYNSAFKKATGQTPTEYRKQFIRKSQ